MVPEWCINYIKITGKSVLKNYPIETIKSVIVNSMCGGNVREFTEPITKERLGILYTGLIVTLIQASEKYSIDEILEKSHEEFLNLEQKDPRRFYLQWILGLTGKQIQNVLRSDDTNVENYLNLAKDSILISSKFAEKEFGKIELQISTKSQKVKWNWQTIHALLASAGTQTLAIRGSEKAIYGKKFQYLILGSSLNLLGFSFDKQCRGEPMTYWFRSKSETRESDATAIIDGENGLRFDIGFIRQGESRNNTRQIEQI